MACTGTGSASGDHCCYVAGERCSYLEENTVPGRRWVCGLRRRLGSWEAVHADPGYVEHVQSVWDELDSREGAARIGSCGEWQPSSGQCCLSETIVEVN